LEAIMRRLSILAAAFAAAAALPGAANAITCYTVLDGSDNAIYQDTQAPVDLSERGAAERDAMRARREFLMISETDRCPTVVPPPGTTGYQASSVESIVSGIREYASAGSGPLPPGAGRGAAKAAPAQRSAPARKY